MKEAILYGVGKKTRNLFLRGELSKDKLMSMYLRNKNEADQFSAYGMTTQELSHMLVNCNNPILKSKLKECIAIRNIKSRMSADQNKVSLEKLSNFMKNALGIGLRKVISIMKKESRKSKDLELKIATLLLETEFANLCAKNHGKQLKSVIYERKSLLLEHLSVLLYNTNWKYGYNDNSGKNAWYIVYIYLPNDVQLSWHSNDYTISLDFPFIDVEWDGRVCATMEKLLEYIGERYNYLFPIRAMAA